MIDAEKELMYTTLYNIACGDTVRTRGEIIRLAAKAIEQVSKLRTQKVLMLAEKKAQENIDGLEISLDDEVANGSKV